ncbi:MAG: transposase [Lachnospiraceae bacterium]|nr:transposase [Lachnospiraceae bacterium]
MIRNSIKYIPSKEYKKYTADLKRVYGAINLKTAEIEFQKFKQTWDKYPGAISVWERNWNHVAQLFNYGSAVRKVMYTTNSIEAINSSFRKVTKKGAFPNEDAVMKILMKYEDLASWYNGYIATNADKKELRIFNPRSVIFALTDNILQSYWTETGPMNEIVSLIDNNVEDVREDMVKMVAGESIEKSGKRCIVEVMDKNTYIDYLDRKLEEELDEYQADKSLEKLADLLEVMYAVTVARGYSVSELESLRREKAKKRGGFEKRLHLKGVVSDGS